MSRRFDEILLHRGRLIERIASQREALRRDVVPVVAALGKADMAVAILRSSGEYCRRHALFVSAGAGVFLVFKGKTALRWARRAFSIWKSWQTLQGAFTGLERRFKEIARG